MTWTRPRILIAAVAVVGILFVGWEKCFSPTALVHNVKLGQTREEVIAIMGRPEVYELSYMLYGRRLSARDIVAAIIPKRPRPAPDYAIIIRLDNDLRVKFIKCNSQDIYLIRR